MTVIPKSKQSDDGEGNEKKKMKMNPTKKNRLKNVLYIHFRFGVIPKEEKRIFKSVSSFTFITFAFVSEVDKVELSAQKNLSFFFNFPK